MSLPRPPFPSPAPSPAPGGNTVKASDHQVGDIVSRIQRRYPDTALSPSDLDRRVRAAFGLFGNARVRAFIAIFVERQVRATIETQRNGAHFG